MNLSSFSHRRFNPLLGEWILVACNRTKRFWPHHTLSTQLPPRCSHNANCSLCPGNTQTEQGDKNPTYDSPCLFNHDYPSLLPDIPLESMNRHDVLIAEGEHGYNRIVSYGPQHNLFFGGLSASTILEIVNIWENQVQDLSSLSDIAYVSIFENRQTPPFSLLQHPHCEILASRHLPTIVNTESRCQQDYFEAHNQCLLCTYVKTELEMQSRIVEENNNIIAIVPFWAHGTEIILLPKQHCSDFSDMPSSVKVDFADILRSVNIRFENLFSLDEPFSMAIHHSPLPKSQSWHFHVHLVVPPCNSLKAKKPLFGYERFFSNYRDNTPEEIARNFRNVELPHTTACSK